MAKKKVGKDTPFQGNTYSVTNSILADVREKLAGEATEEASSRYIEHACFLTGAGFADAIVAQATLCRASTSRCCYNLKKHTIELAIEWPKQKVRLNIDPRQVSATYFQDGEQYPPVVYDDFYEAATHLFKGFFVIATDMEDSE